MKILCPSCGSELTPKMSIKSENGAYFEYECAHCNTEITITRNENKKESK